jgi:hypothetical protein
MPYKEPGVYLQVKNNPRGAITPGPLPMIPLIIGSGAKKLTKIVSITRASAGQVDTFPVESVASITRIGMLKTGASDWVETTDPLDPQDYAFVADSNEIEWEAGAGPDAGEMYYATIVYNIESTQYEPTLCGYVSEIEGKYGPDVQENETGTPICPVSLAAQMVLENGSPSVYVQQVECVGSTPTAAEYQAALDTYTKFMPGVWRIIAADQSADVQAVVKGHIALMSTYEERAWRCGAFGKVYTVAAPAATAFADVLTQIGGFAEGFVDKRISVIYPDRATRVLSDGSTRELSAPYLLAALAGRQWALPTERSLTRQNVFGFYQLVGVKMTRTQMNSLAAKGVTLLTQDTPGAPIIVRHSLSTDMSSTQSREPSILAIQDYCSKSFKEVCEQYIGKHNITPEVINMIKGSLDADISRMIGLGKILSGTVTSIEQDVDNPDTVLVSVSVLPPYPCNYIDIVVVLE